MSETKKILQITPFYVKGKRCPFGLKILSKDPSINGKEFYRKSADAAASVQDLLEKYFADAQRTESPAPAPANPAQ